ncbi:MAG: hypothetical protein ACK5LR_03980, partial [Mangrovibacterium sp.]
SYWAYSPNSGSIPFFYLNSAIGYKTMYGQMTDKLSRFSTTTHYKSGEVNIHLGFGASIGTFYFKCFQVEKGNKATAWSSSPADVQAYADVQAAAVQSSLDVFKTETTSQFTVQANQIAAKVSQTDFNALGDRVGAAESAIVQTASDITLAVSESKSYADQQDEALVSSLSITANKITLKSKTIELNGTTIAKAIEAEDLHVGSSTALAELKVSAKGLFYARGGNGASSLEIDSEKQIIEIKSAYVEADGSTPSGSTVLRMSSANGGFSARGATDISNNSAAILSSGGVFANTALQGIYAATTGVTAKGSIVGLGWGNVAKGYYNEQFVAGVYGRASNAGDGGAYGGYFENLKVSGLILNLKSLTEATTYLSDANTYVVSGSSSQRIVYLPSSPQVGQTIFIKQWMTGYIRVYPYSGYVLYDDSTENTYIDVGQGWIAMLTYIGDWISGKTWQLNKFKF